MNFIDIKTKEKVKILEKLASEIWNEYWTIILSQSQIDYMLDKFQSYSAINNQIENEQYIYHILEDDEKFLGYLGVSLKEEYLFLSKLYIKKDFRGLGCGKIAFNKIKQIAQNNNKKSIRLTVNKNNVNTIKTYEKWGFKIIASVVTDIGNNFVMDDYIMEFKL